MEETKPAIAELDHVLFVRGGYGSTYTRRGINDCDLLLLSGVPEPISNFEEWEYVQALLDDNVVVRCTEQGILADGTKHHSIP